MTQKQTDRNKRKKKAEEAKKKTSNNCLADAIMVSLMISFSYPGLCKNGPMQGRLYETWIYKCSFCTKTRLVCFLVSQYTCFQLPNWNVILSRQIIQILILNLAVKLTLKTLTLKPRTDDQVFLDKFLGSFTCSCVQWTSFSPRAFLDKFYLLVCTA